MHFEFPPILQFPLKFIIGIILIATNHIVAWAGMLTCAYFAQKPGKKRHVFAGTLIYAFSWVMLAAGILLAGKEGLLLIKNSFIYDHHGMIGGLLITVSLIVILIRFMRKRMLKRNEIKD